MPRPRRTKIASTAARVVDPKPAPHKHAMKATIAQIKTTGKELSSFSEDSDGLVTKSPNTRLRRRNILGNTPNPVEEIEVRMTGALPVENSPPEDLAQEETNVARSSKRTRTSGVNLRSSAKQLSSFTTSSSRKRSLPGDEHTAQPQLDEWNSFDDLTFSSLGSNSPAHGTRPPSAVKVGATPAHERSVLALTNFKRRARQPSLLRMVQQTTDAEDNDRRDDDSTGNFDFDDFLPHAESTPLNIRSQVAEDEARNDSGAQVSSSGSRGTKRKFSPLILVPRSSPPFSPPSGADLETTRSPSPRLPEALRSQEVVEQTQDSPEVMSETFAPPLSSSPVPTRSNPCPSPAPPRRRRAGRRAKTTTKHDESDPEDTDVRVNSKREIKSKAPPAISTAQLKNLLPRRRNRSRDRDEFDLNSSDMGEPVESDQDELQMADRLHRQRPGTSKAVASKVNKKQSRSKIPVTAGKAPRLSRTYSRRISSDKENDVAEHEEGVNEVSSIEHSEKLAAIRRKFEEVDAFELDFEIVDVTTTTTSSSPFR